MLPHLLSESVRMLRSETRVTKVTTPRTTSNFMVERIYQIRTRTMEINFRTEYGRLPYNVLSYALEHLWRIVNIRHLDTP